MDTLSKKIIRHPLKNSHAFMNICPLLIVAGSQNQNNIQSKRQIRLIFNSVFHQFREAKFDNDGSILSSSQF